VPAEYIVQLGRYLFPVLDYYTYNAYSIFHTATPRFFVYVYVNILTYYASKNKSGLMGFQHAKNVKRIGKHSELPVISPDLPAYPKGID
jgi:hypothetical protein